MAVDIDRSRKRHDEPCVRPVRRGAWKPRTQTLPSHATLSGRLLTRFFVRNYGLCATIDASFIDPDAVAAAGWAQSPDGPGLERGRYVLLPGVGTPDWRLLTTTHVLPSFAEATASVSDIVPASAVTSVRIVPLGLRAPVRLAVGVVVPGGRARTRCEVGKLALVGGRKITLQISSSTAGNSEGVFADAFTFPMSKSDGGERRAVYPFDARQIQARLSLTDVARDLADVMDCACAFVSSLPGVRFDASLKLRQRTLGGVYLTGSGARAFVFGLPTAGGMARFRVDYTPGLVERLNERSGLWMRA